MLRFIFFCMAFIAISFFAVPAYFGISEEHQKLTQTAAIETSSDSLTFKEIYALADASPINDPSTLNAIASAAGNDKNADIYSHGFSGKEDSALAEIKIDVPSSEETINF